jgi:hypothetical protein
MIYIVSVPGAIGESDLQSFDNILEAYTYAKDFLRNFGTLTQIAPLFETRAVEKWRKTPPRTK